MNKILIATLISLVILFAQVKANGLHDHNQAEQNQDQGEQASNQEQDQPVEEEQFDDCILTNSCDNHDEGETEGPVEEEPFDECILTNSCDKSDEGETDGPVEEEPFDECILTNSCDHNDEGEFEGPTEEEPYDECILTNSCVCHPSCICEKGTSVCSKCVFESIGAVFDDHKKSCPCPTGYYTSSVKPFQCSQLFVVNTQGNEIDSQGACDKEVRMKTKYVSLNTNCYYCIIDGQSFINSDVSLNFNSVSISNDCKSHFSHKIQFLHPTSLNYVSLEAKYFTNGENGSLKIKIPLIDVYHMTQSTQVGEQQISQQINLMSLIGTKDRVIKQIKWAICIYTNRDQVQVFQFDTDILQTEQNCEDCIVIADLETIDEVYTDETFTTKVTGSQSYFVGDYFYAKIKFVDPTYTKYLKFVSLFYKNDLGQIYDYSSITVHAWQNNGLTIAFPLSEPSHPAIIQVQMLIDSVSGGRFLQTSNQSNSENQKSNFSISVDSNQNQQQSKNIDQDSTSSQLLFLSLINLIVAILLI